VDIIDNNYKQLIDEIINKLRNYGFIANTTEEITGILNGKDKIKRNVILIEKNKKNNFINKQELTIERKLLGFSNDIKLYDISLNTNIYLKFFNLKNFLGLETGQYITIFLENDSPNSNFKIIIDKNTKLFKDYNFSFDDDIINNLTNIDLESRFLDFINNLRGNLIQKYSELFTDANEQKINDDDIYKFLYIILNNKNNKNLSNVFRGI
jgi:hypothetical protein